MPNFKLISDARFGMCLTATLASLLIASPSFAGSFYSWTAEDGSVAYADDLKKVPARYHSQVKTLSSKKLEGYKFYTPQDKDGLMDYSQQLAARLVHLRGVNAEPKRAPRAPEVAGIGSLFVGGGVEVPIAIGDEPIVTERVRVPGMEVTARVDEVVSQGDRPVAVIRNIAGSWEHRRVMSGADEIYGADDEAHLGDSIDLHPSF